MKGYNSAKCKSFDDREETERALASSPYVYIGRSAEKKTADSPTLPDTLPVAAIENSLAVDVVYNGNPGSMEYRGVHVVSQQEILHFGPVKGTNNIGESLALIHGLALLKQKKFDIPIYSDSTNAISWAKQKKCKTRLSRAIETEKSFGSIERAKKWFKEDRCPTSILKWEAKQWGEVPTDFGRK